MHTHTYTHIHTRIGARARHMHTHAINTHRANTCVVRLGRAWRVLSWAHHMRKLPTWRLQWALACCSCRSYRAWKHKKEGTYNLRNALHFRNDLPVHVHALVCPTCPRSSGAKPQGEPGCLTGLHQNAAGAVRVAASPNQLSGCWGQTIQKIWPSQPRSDHIDNGAGPCWLLQSPPEPLVCVRLAQFVMPLCRCLFASFLRIQWAL